MCIRDRLGIIKHIVIELAQQITNSFMQWNENSPYAVITLISDPKPPCSLIFDNTSCFGVSEALTSSHKIYKLTIGIASLQMTSPPGLYHKIGYVLPSTLAWY